MRRRPVVKGAFAFKLGGLKFSGGTAHQGRAGGATPSAGEATPAIPAVVTAYVDALNAHDPRAVAALYTDDAVVEQAALNGNTFQGTEAIAGWVADNLAGLPDLVVTPGSAVEAGNRLAWEWVDSGIYTGQYPGAPAGTGQPIALRGVSVMELRDGKIARETLYFDNYAFLTQIGALEPAGTPTT